MVVLFLLFRFLRVGLVGFLAQNKIFQVGRVAFVGLGAVLLLGGLQAQGPVVVDEEAPREPLFHFSQGFRYVRQLSRRDNIYQGGTFSRTDDRILLQDVTLYKFTSFLSYRSFSVFYDQGVYRPSMLHYEPFSDAYETLDEAELYQWQLGASVQRGPFRIGAGYLNKKKDDDLEDNQLWQPFHDESLIYYGAFQYAFWEGPVHFEGRLELNPNQNDWGEAYTMVSLGMLFYFNYYANMKIRYYRYGHGSSSLSRHGLEYLFSYHLLYNVALVVGINKILYSENESPMQAFTAGVQVHVAAF